MDNAQNCDILIYHRHKLIDLIPSFLSFMLNAETVPQTRHGLSFRFFS
jgi:hypothetical protein